MKWKWRAAELEITKFCVDDILSSPDQSCWGVFLGSRHSIINLSERNGHQRAISLFHFRHLQGTIIFHKRPSGDFLRGFSETAFKDRKLKQHVYYLHIISLAQNAWRDLLYFKARPERIWEVRRACAYLPSTYMYFSGLWGWEVCQPQGVMLESYSWHLCFVPLRRRSPSRPRRIRSLTLSCALRCAILPIVVYPLRANNALCGLTQNQDYFHHSAFIQLFQQQVSPDSNNFAFAAREHCGVDFSFTHIFLIALGLNHWVFCDW